MVLFDEIEKAAPDVFNVFLQILDDGRLTDGQGRVVDFKNTIIIMTSNIGSHRILDYKGTDEAEYTVMRATVIDELRRNFRPEFLNRVDEIVVFKALSEEQLERIVEIQLRRLSHRLADRRITIELSPEAGRHWCSVGYDPVYGARPSNERSSASWKRRWAARSSGAKSSKATACAPATTRQRGTHLRTIPAPSPEEAVPV